MYIYMYLCVVIQTIKKYIERDYYFVFVPLMIALQPD